MVQLNEDGTAIKVETPEEAVWLTGLVEKGFQPNKKLSNALAGLGKKMEQQRNHVVVLSNEDSIGSLLSCLNSEMNTYPFMEEDTKLHALEEGIEYAENLIYNMRMEQARLTKKIS
jgi:hypothetical protein